MTKPKAKVKPEVVVAIAKPSERVAEVWHTHPKLTLAAIATVVAIVSGTVPILLAVIHFFATHDELETHKQHDESVAAWTQVQGIRTELVGMRNRVNDCDIIKERRQAMTDLERKACNQYAEEFADATRRYQAAQTAAKLTTKEK